MTDPWQQFADWFRAAQAHEPELAEACALATVALVDGCPRPDVRMVLLKAQDARGFTFYTNAHSTKGRQLAATPWAALDFHWKSLRRQVRTQGPVAAIADAESDAYFASRPRASQLSAWASLQSEPLPARAEFEARMAEMAVRFPDAVPRPPHWHGYRLQPEWIEFWEERPGRQHERARWQRREGGWEMTLLYP